MIFLYLILLGLMAIILNYKYINRQEMVCDSLYSVLISSHMSPLFSKRMFWISACKFANWGVYIFETNSIESTTIMHECLNIASIRKRPLSPFDESRTPVKKRKFMEKLFLGKFYSIINTLTIIFSSLRSFRINKKSKYMT